MQQITMIGGIALIFAVGGFFLLSTYFQIEKQESWWVWRGQRRQVMIQKTLSEDMQAFLSP